VLLPTLHQLEVFITTARRQSFARAAEELFLSPPSVSLQVQRLEQHYGARLFERTSRGPVLTPAGLILKEATEVVLARLEEAAAGIERTKVAGRARLGVGATMMLGIHRLPIAVALMRRRRPTVDVNLLVSDHQQLEEALLRRTLEVVLTGRDVQSPHLRQELLCLEHLPLLVSTRNPLANRASVAPELLAGQTLLMRESGSQTRRAVEAAIAEHGLRFRQVLEMQSMENLVQSLVANRGIGFAPLAWCEIEHRQGQVVPITVEGLSIEVTFYQAHRADEPLSEAARLFLDVCREVMSGPDLLAS
jgi:DNA-binding transcriptional LysR family regulator